MIPEDIQVFLQENREGSKIIDFRPASGGCINNGGRLSTSEGDFFLKWNSASRYPGMFEVESRGLKRLKEAGTIRVPEVELSGVGKSHSFLLMEYVQEGARKKDFFERMGSQLAKLHKISNSQFGLDYDNYIGSLPQYNGRLNSWPEFFISRRLEPQIKIATDSGSIQKKDHLLFEKLYPKLESYFPEESPSLIHGDLWSGNFMADEKGEPCIFDPAVYFGHREMDIAMTRLFGGFDAEFYHAYNTEYRHEGGVEERMDLYNLYPLLVHVNLFGGSYWMQIKSILRRFI